MGSIIQEKINAGTLKLWHDYKSGTVDDFSGNGNDGSFTSSPYFNRDGLNFDGVDDKLLIGSNPIPSNSDFTLCCWVKTGMENDTTSARSSVLGSAIFATSVKGVMIGDVSASGDMSIAWGDDVNSADIVLKSAAFSNYNSRWYFYCARYDLSETKMHGYSDGAEIAGGGTVLEYIDSGTNDFAVGHSVNLNSGAAYMSGGISQVMVFSEGLTDTEINKLMSETHPNNTKWPSKPKSKTKATQLQPLNELTSHWTMKPQANAIPDDTGAGNDASITGNPTFVNTILGPGALLTDSTNGFDTGSDWMNTNAFTFGCWINLDGYGGNNVGRLFDNEKSLLYTNNTNDTLTFTSDGINFVAAGTNSIKLNKLNFVCVTRTNGGVTNFYVNGVLSGNADQDSGTPTNGTSNVIIGNRNLNDRGLEGTIIEPFAIIGTVETAEQIAERYKKGAELVQYKTDWGTKVSDGNVTSGQLEDTDWWINSGSWKVDTDTINGEKVKVIECVSDGTLYIPIDSFITQEDAAYGSWGFWVNKADASTTDITFIGNNLTPNSAGNYSLILQSDESVDLVERTVTTLFASAASYVSVGTWSKFKITRRYDGQFSVYMNDSLVTVDSGTNPVTDNTTTTSPYILFDIDSGDKIAIADKQGDKAITKYLGVK